MNRGKSYRILAVIMFIAFISLISRSIIYLILSLTIGVIIITLLKNDNKDKEKASSQPVNNKGAVEKTGLLKRFLPYILLLSGSIMLAYGLGGLFALNTMFHQTDVMTDSPLILSFFSIGGAGLAVFGLILFLKLFLKK